MDTNEPETLTIPEKPTIPDASGLLTLPDATPGASPAQAGAAPVAGGPSTPAPAANVARDRAGVAFDPTIHEVDRVTGTGRLSIKGLWMRRRGNGARVAAGKPMAGATSGNKPSLVIPDGVSPAPAGGADKRTDMVTDANGTATPSAASSDQAPPVTTEAAPATQALGDYDTTAEAVTNGVWAVAQMAGGSKWAPETDEWKAWKFCLQRLWFRYGLPQIGPLAELFILAGRAVAKRCDSGDVKGFFMSAWQWANGRKPVGVPNDQPGAARP